VQIGDEPVRLQVLQERIRQAILPRDDKSLLIRMDASVTAQDIFTVLGELKAAGVDKVGFSSRPMEGRR